MLKRLIWIGIVAGGIFGLLFRVIEQLTGKKVYTLLMNVDYFPIVKHWNLHEVTEFSFHLIVSIIVVLVLYYVLRKPGREQRVFYYIGINVLIGGVLYLTTILSERTPELADMTAFTYWLGGHAIFGALVGMMIKFSRSYII